MATDIKKIVEQILAEANGEKIHIRMEMPYTWGVTLTGEVDDTDIKVTHEYDFAKYANEFRTAHPETKCNIIDFSMTKKGNFKEIPRYDDEFQKEQDAL